MESDMIALVLVEIAAGIVVGFALWSWVSPRLVNATPIIA
jgi:hypothetical protein